MDARGRTATEGDGDAPLHEGPAEITAMGSAARACEASMTKMGTFARAEIPGRHLTEDDIRAVPHAANPRRGGEGVETRLLAPGPRTTPWFGTAIRAGCARAGSSPSTAARSMPTAPAAI